MVTSSTQDLPGRWRVADSYADPYADALREARAVRSWQRLAIVAGTGSLALGLVLLFWPAPTLGLAAGVLGAWLIVAGAVCLVEAVVAGEGSSGSRALSAVAGLLYLIVGLLCVRNLLTSVELLAIVVGIAWIAGGISEVISAVTGQRGGWARAGAVAAGAVGVTGGTVLAFWPAVTPRTLAYLAALTLLATGAVQAALALRATRLTRDPS
jgi:uncharacterized membrane protein HdeD (DUF308 family)